ncbi:PQQ-binding-like beta-propeller repeat protein [Paenibacillus solani]|uniref:outer membrane protein assembly factor BamB family protein n=1 Tax=Paenibacillus solani TaxID=1705565 RepID=UPI003D27FC9F
MKWKFAKSMLIASIIMPLLAYGTPAHAKELSQPEWVVDVAKGTWSLPTIHNWGIVKDSQGNESLLGLKTAANKNYLENIDPTTGQIRWSIPQDFGFFPSEDGYIFMVEKKNQISAMHLASGKKLWTSTLPFSQEPYDSYYYYENMYPGDNGSLYVVSDSKDHKSTLYYYDSAGHKTKKYTVPYLIVNIEGDYVFAKTYNDDPNTYIINLATGKKIRTVTDGNSYLPVNVLKDGTLIAQNVAKNTLTLKAFNPSGQLKWTKKLPYVNGRTEVYTLQDRFLFIDGKSDTLKLYASDGKLISSKSYKPIGTGYNRYWSLAYVAKDQQSFMFTVNKGNKYEIIIMDSKNLNVIKSFTEDEYYNNSDYELLNNKTDLYIIDSYGKGISKYDLHNM